MTPNRALTVDCPTCGARRGQPCRTLKRSGRGRPATITSFHRERVKLANARRAEERKLANQIERKVDVTQAEARQLARRMLQAERRGPSLGPKGGGNRLAAKNRKRLPKPKVDPLSFACPKCGAAANSPCTNMAAGNRLGEPIKGAHSERRMVAVNAWIDERKPGYADWLAQHGKSKSEHQQRVKDLIRSSRSEPHHYRGTPETYEQVGVDPQIAGDRSKSSTLGKLYATGRITGDQLELAAEICEAHYLVAGETMPRGMDPTSAGGSGGSKRWTVNDASARELILEESYRDLRNEIGVQPMGMPLVQNIAVFELELADLVSAPHRTEGALVATFITHLEKWEKCRRWNERRDRVAELVEMNEARFKDAENKSLEDADKLLKLKG